MVNAQGSIPLLLAHAVKRSHRPDPPPAELSHWTIPLPGPPDWLDFGLRLDSCCKLPIIPAVASSE